MHEDVTESRRTVSRRRALGLGGSVGLGALLTACGATGSGSGTSGATTVPTEEGTSATVSPGTTSSSDLVAKLDGVDVLGVAPETTEGPYWFDVDSIRSDIREDRPGTTLQVALRVQDAENAAIPNSVVEIWHCDAGGVYSGFEVASTGGGGAPGGSSSDEVSDGSYSEGAEESTPTDDGTYLRGAQVADANGIVQFTTIYPGWYRGRTVHIHCRVHIDKQTVLTTQLFFDEEVNDAAYEAEPYSAHTGRDTTNDNDSIYEDARLLNVEQASDGYLAYLNLGAAV